MTSYQSFLDSKSQFGNDAGFEPLWMPDFLFDFQQSLVEWAIRKGRCALFEDCGLGKTPQQLVWAENVVRHANKPVLILAPLAVAQQTAREAEKFGIDCRVSRDGSVQPNITVTNYERLHYFDPDKFAGIVCDESSILKSFTGARRRLVTRFMSKMPYRLLCTATAAPNDYVELGTSSEALGELSHSDMLTRFFQQLDDKGQKRETKLQEEAESIIRADSSYFQKLAYRVAQTIGQWRLKHHAVQLFWRWVCSWARACRMPSDLGFPDKGFALPKLIERDHVITPSRPPDGFLFNMPAKGMGDERRERRRTLQERCEFVASLVDHKKPAVVWAQMNPEADLLEEMIGDAKQISGRTPDDTKAELYEAFAAKQLRVLVIKPKIGAFGLNWQHCNHVVTFVSHSYEQYYQSVRRCWRFGQKLPVTVDVIATEGESRVLANVRRKSEAADRMFCELVKQMNNVNAVRRQDIYTNAMERPQWLSATN